MKVPNAQGVSILATGSAVPDLRVNNHILSKYIDTSDEWIVTRTGIKERRLLAGSNDSIVDLAVTASIRALEKVSILSSDIDLIILATSTPNDLFGSASQLQSKIGAIHAVAFDLTAACSGFVLALVTASQFIQNGSYKNVLVVGADALSKWVDWSDRNTCILFGDGAAAVLLQACSLQKNTILGFQLNTDGQYNHYLSLTYKNQLNPYQFIDLYKGSFQSIYMNGREVYKFAVSQVPLSILECLNSLNISVQEVDWLLLHQANNRILKAVADKLSIEYSKIIMNLDKYGNTSAASIPLALDEALYENKIMHNDLIVISGFGAGLTWGTIVIRWKTH